MGEEKEAKGAAAATGLERRELTREESARVMISREASSRRLLEAERGLPLLPVGTSSESLGAMAMMGACVPGSVCVFTCVEV